jgi:hypothetical protein
MTTDSQVQYLLDRLAIQDVLATYAKGHDDFQGNQNQYEGTLETWSRVFTHDGEVDYTSGDGPRGPWREMLSWMRGAPGKPGRMTGAFSRWQHMLGLPLVTIDGDTATARQDLLATHTTEDGGVHFYDACTFTDDLVRTPEGWRISFRTLEVHWAGALPTTKDFNLE